MGVCTESLILGRKQGKERRGRICCSPGMERGDLIHSTANPGDKGIHIFQSPSMLCLATVCVSMPVAVRVFGSRCVLHFKLKRIF